MSPFYFAWKAQTCLFLWLLLQSLAENFRLTRLASIKVSKLAPYCRNRYRKEQVVIFFVFFYFSFILKNKRTNAVPTFFLLGAAEAAAGLLELVAVNFDHPKRAKDLCQVRGLVTGGQRSHSDKVWISARLDGMIYFFSSWTRLTRQRGRSSTWWRLRWWPRRCLRSGCRPGPRWGNRRSCWCPDTPLKHSRDSQNHNPSQ